MADEIPNPLPDGSGSSTPIPPIDNIHSIPDGFTNHTLPPPNVDTEMPEADVCPEKTIPFPPHPPIQESSFLLSKKPHHHPLISTSIHLFLSLKPPPPPPFLPQPTTYAPIPSTSTSTVQRTATPTRQVNGTTTTTATPAAAAVEAVAPPMPSKAASHGAPARRYLNEKVTGVLLEGMKRLAADQYVLCISYLIIHSI